MNIDEMLKEIEREEREDEANPKNHCFWCWTITVNKDRVCAGCQV